MQDKIQQRDVLRLELFLKRQHDTMIPWIHLISPKVYPPGQNVIVNKSPCALLFTVTDTIESRLSLSVVERRLLLLIFDASMIRVTVDKPLDSAERSFDFYFL